MIPLIMFEYKRRDFKEVMSPIDEGMDPVNLLLYISKYCNLFNFPISEGMIPVRLFEYKERNVR